MAPRKPRQDDAQTENHGRFEKDGVERDAGTAAEAVALKFDGWQLIDQPAASSAPAE